MHRTTGRNRLGTALTAAVAVGIAMAGSAAAAAPTGSSQVADDTLAVVGTSGADRIALRLAPGDPGSLQVDLDDDGAAEATFPRSSFSRIEVRLLSGADRFRVDQTNGAFADDPVTVDAGRGDDVVDTGDGNDVVLGGAGDDDVDGNRGVDSVALGSGQDTFTWDPGDGSDAVDGGRGEDTLVFNGSGGAETMHLSAEGRTSLFFRDPGGIRMDMHDVEVVDVAAVGGADAITIDDLSGSTFRQANVDLGVDGQADRVTVVGSEVADVVTVGAIDAQVDVTGLAAGVRITSAKLADDRLQIEARDGNDQVDVSAQAAALIAVLVDLGSGQL
jgi:Ca2+-binding RTX toxin-like protein